MSEITNVLDYKTIGLTTSFVIVSLAWFFYNRSTSNQVKSLTRYEELKSKLDELSKQSETSIKQVKKDLGTIPDSESENVDNEKYIYRLNYDSEELLKLLIKLDGVEVLQEDELNEIEYIDLKTQRKGLIKEIQLVIKELDLKKKLFS